MGFVRYGRVILEGSHMLFGCALVSTGYRSLDLQNDVLISVGSERNFR